MLHPHCQYENQRPVRLCLRPCSCPYRPCRCRPCHQEHIVLVVKVILHGRVLLRTVEQIVRAPALQIMLQERFRPESPRSVWMSSVPDFGKRCPRGEAPSSTRIHHSPRSFSRIVFLGRQRNRRSVFWCHLFFPLTRSLRTSLPAPQMNSQFLTSSAHIAQKKKQAARELWSRFGETELRARDGRRIEALLPSLVGRPPRKVGSKQAPKGDRELPPKEGCSSQG